MKEKECPPHFLWTSLCASLSTQRHRPNGHILIMPHQKNFGTCFQSFHKKRNMTPTLAEFRSLAYAVTALTAHFALRSTCFVSGEG